MIGRHNKESLLNEAHNENAFFALGHKKPKNAPIPAAANEYDSDEFPEGEELVGKKGKRRGFRSAISQSQYEEKKRQQLD